MAYCDAAMQTWRAPLEAAVTLDPHEVSALQLLALAYQQMPNSAKGLEQLAAKAVDPKSPPILLATVCEKQQKVDQAINSYESLLARNLFTSAVRNNLAFLMAEPLPEARREPEGSEGGSCGILLTIYNLP